jgi:hypothetical protein
MFAWCRNSLVIAVALLVLSACSGGGGGGAGQQGQPPAKQGAGEWNQLIWDQDSWK